MAVANSIQSQLDEAEHVIRAQMARIAELEAEVERLRSAANAHDVLKSIYSDANQPTGHRLKAAGLALGHESPPLKSVEAPLELVAEVIEPLAAVVERQRARADRLLALPLAEREALIKGAGVRRDGGNGSDEADGRRSSNGNGSGD